jgi:hypothetical protein
MSENSTEVLIEVLLEEGDPAELEALTRQLQAEVAELHVDAIQPVSLGAAPEGSKALDMAAVGQMMVTLAPTVVPPLFELLKSWVERKPSTPVKIRIKVGNRTAQIEYDPTRTSAEDLEQLVKALNKSLKK